MLNLVDQANQDSSLLKAQAHIWNHIFNFINSTSLKSAIQLGIPDVIHRHVTTVKQPMTLLELAAAISINPAKTRSLARLMRLLVHSEFFALEKVNDDDQEGYVLTATSQLLLTDNPLSVTPFLMAMLDPTLLKPWHHVSEWFANDDPTPFDTAHGETFWEFAGAHQELNGFFNDAMASDARLVTKVLVNECRHVFEGLGSLVDVGGGTGTVAKAIAGGFPAMECTVLDLPHVVEGLESEGLESVGNLRFVGGDMFVEIPAADAVLLKWILHDWSDEECVKILKKSKEAIQGREGGREGGKVIIIDMKVENQKANNDESIETQLFFDMLMMILVTGRERDEKEWAKLFVDAGFRDYKITPILGLRSIIEVYP
ncbi:Probable O-methyltransferase 3 [Linum perenne]